MTEEKIIVFTDGASKGNPGPGGFAAVIVFLKNNNGGNSKSQTLNSKNAEVLELGGREENTTNNRMELTAAIKALEFLSSYKLKTINYKLTLYTDSNYLINGITKWIYAWQKNNWQTKNKEPVLNKDLWQKLSELSEKFSIEWKHVKGHTGTPGNERADEIASNFAAGKTPNLFSGPKDFPRTDLAPRARSVLGKGGARTQAKAYSYLSMIDGVIKKHQTWAECEKRVKGKSRAKFRKALSAEEEREIIRGWRG